MCGKHERECKAGHKTGMHDLAAMFMSYFANAMAPRGLVCVMMTLSVTNLFAVQVLDSARDPDSLVIAKDGSSAYEIIIDSNAPEGVREGATELRRLMEKSTGAVLSIRHAPSFGHKQIFVGEHKLARNNGITGENMPEDSYRIRIEDGTIYLIGKDDSRQSFYLLNNNKSASAGSYYAMVDFVRRYLGARWYMPGPLGEEVTKITKLEVPAKLDISASPRFAMRSIAFTQKKSQKYEDQLRKNRMLRGTYYNDDHANEAYRWGRHLRLGSNLQLNVAHSWHQWVPADNPTKYSPQAYGKSHPEYFAVPGGKRGKYYYGDDNSLGGQLCVCNPDVAEVFAQNIIAYAKKSGERNFSLSPNDGDWECSCACCKDWKSRNEAGEILLTDRILDFSNRISERVIRQIPDARFGLYAYHWILEPPVSSHKSPYIDISDVYNGIAYRFYKSEEKTSMERLMRGWRSRVDNIVLTTYYTFFGHYSLPWSSIDVQSWMIKLLSEYASSVGIRMNYAQLDFPPMGILGPDPWVLSELLWDPDQSVEKLVNEFYLGAFGPDAGPLIREYFATINESMTTTIRELPYQGGGGVGKYIEPGYGPVRETCRTLIDRAVHSVKDSDNTYRWRVDRVAKAWSLVELTLDAMEAARDGLQKKAVRILRERKKLLDDADSVFALAPASLDRIEIVLPLVAE